MTKRTCPFPEAFSTQYKIHIGQREINNYGVFGNKYRQEIYEKTKNLLFNGAKAVVGKIWTGEKCPDSQSNGEHSACSQTLLRGQTLIGQDGKLTRTNALQGKCRLKVRWSEAKMTHIVETISLLISNLVKRTELIQRFSSHIHIIVLTPYAEW
ncbi:hypothetical protein ILYODFUR_004140 [Ilyodon furcidens]|uniref:Uncharacterized protein n=1 Tax=Ilyodon furcidens TaxID=33524 RepID=A0ABV0UQ81_9TELE